MRAISTTLLTAFSLIVVACGNQQPSNCVSKAPPIFKALQTSIDGLLPINQRIPNPYPSPPPHDYYDYGASSFDTNDTREIWWCGGAVTATISGSTPDPAFPASDGIYYAKYNKATGQIIEAPRVVLYSIPSGNTWDKSYVCDPSVIKGVFSYNNAVYSYAMYYTATDRGPGSSYSQGDFDGTNNRLGVAFSNDGKSWTRVANPVVSPLYTGNVPQTTQNGATDSYGAGQSAVYNSNGQAGIWLIYTDTSESSNPCGGSHIYRRISNDGITFGPPIEVSTSGLLGSNVSSIGNGDFVFDPVSHYWYATFRTNADVHQAAWQTASAIRYTSPGNCPRINTADPEVQNHLGRQADFESYQVGIYKMPESQFPTGTWQPVGFVNTNLTGFALNHNTSIARDLYGNIYSNRDGITSIFSAGANPIYTSDWDLESITLTENPNTSALIRYYDPSSDRHRMSTGVVTSNFQYISTLGYLNNGRSAEEAGLTVPLYACQVGPKDALTQEYFNTTASNCEGQYTLGIQGFIYSFQPASISTRPLYRCYTGRNHFISTASNCEGQTVIGLLGYAKTSP